MRSLVVCWAAVIWISWCTESIRSQETCKDPIVPSQKKDDLDEKIRKLFDRPPSLPLAPTDPADIAARTHLPKDAKDWDFIGSFRLKDREIVLYSADTDSMASKEMARTKWGMTSGFIYPNCFSIHVVYQGPAGKWVHKEVYSACRVGFLRVEKCTHDAIVLELTPKYVVNLSSFKNSKEALKRGEEINKPFSVRLWFENGIPFVK